MDDYDKQLEKLLDSNRSTRQFYKNDELQDGLKTYEDAITRSTKSSKISYTNTKRNNQRKKVNRAIAAAALVITIAVPSVISSNITKNVIENNNVVIALDNHEEINEKINNYQKLMSLNSDNKNKIETLIDRDNNGNAIVDYTPQNIDNLVNHIINASEISETEARCVIIAAFNLINEPYRENVLKETFTKLETYENNSYTGQLLSNGMDNFLEQLGYTDLEDYKLNERDNIKKLNAVETYIGGKNR